MVVPARGLTPRKARLAKLRERLAAEQDPARRAMLEAQIAHFSRGRGRGR